MDNHLSSQLPYQDFLIYWHWLTGTRGNDSFVVKRVERDKVDRVFASLELFASSRDMESFIGSWGCQQRDTITFDELQDGMTRLTSSQNEKFNRFMLALRMKHEADTKCKQDRQRVIDRQLKKEEQKEKSRKARRTKQFDTKQKMSTFLHPKQKSRMSMMQRLNTQECKEKVNMGHSMLSRLSTFVRMLSRASVGSGTSSSDNESDQPSPTPRAQKKLVIKANSDDSCDEGFTYRLTLANLEVMENERNLGKPSSMRYSSTRHHTIVPIDESLVSFGESSLFSDDHISHVA